MSKRFIILSTLFLALSAPAFAQQDEVQTLREQMAQMRADKQREIEDLRRRLTEADDKMLELARKYDQTKKRLQDENEALLDEVTSLRKENALLKAKGGAKGDEKKKKKKKDDAVLDEKTLTLSFDETPLSEVGMFLRDIAGVNIAFDKSVPEDAQVSLSLKDKTIRQAMDALCELATTAEGEPLPLKWRFKKGVIEVKKKK